MGKITAEHNKYEASVLRVLAYIDKHLGDDLNLTELAGLSGFSLYYFQRIIHASLGEPLYSYIIRSKLNRAAGLLSGSEEKISSIAYLCGYDCPSSLTKQFKRSFGVSPSDYRNSKSTYIMEKVSMTTELNLKGPKLVELGAKNLIYIEAKGGYSDLDYSGAFEKLWSYVKKHGVYGAGIEHISVYYSNPQEVSEENLVTRICLACPKAVDEDENIRVCKLPGGKYAKFTYIGSYSNFTAVYDKIFGELFPSSGYLPRDNFSFEKYYNDPRRVSEDKLKTEIYIPVE